MPKILCQKTHQHSAIRACKPDCFNRVFHCSINIYQSPLQTRQVIDSKILGWTHAHAP